MLRDKSNIKPTEAELTLLNILWKIGPATVRQVHDTVSQSQKTGYTTVLKILQIMHEKTLVIRDESNRAHVYAPSNSEMVTQSSLLKDLVLKAFGGSTSKLVMRALDNSTSKEEIEDIRQLLNELEQQS
ncbi:MULTISPECIES: BlaI/MecI/CopY family transcriptional regulator [unclassified Colwellia]|jgi:BlaI family penicillinase repressor|uniref:BlaI/MecI/CopY family transcriptional regulator n=1 Tax=unclassified Colwellia TaxID=196834 RepID=UPI0015F6B8C5|nr:MULTISPECIES: BlaI/MecI/CopY family transcriptional regulator [unclassified Colwellia]MBA6225860.1 BlaI/MecI/CopY family transcriptional regulator [Colwellia sp. MB3u-45]MBA6267096.1 BlaI/MecI/CopY family transcriptional regulator [Colwellia sp. MB3u-43]MBA6290396.1 BlaI/MecI/CopY family transcriptional regulator [Colwellia sp. MB3u-4]MBA6294030.1 BlaI/MecI/CopY family transcriptional regulator [Colwellia sp. MB3u-8]MBA6295183.1 BlaI/MecI/CopY family transcriptional regulator [Colwellia sp.